MCAKLTFVFQKISISMNFLCSIKSLKTEPNGLIVKVNLTFMAKQPQEILNVREALK